MKLQPLDLEHADLNGCQKKRSRSHGRKGSSVSNTGITADSLRSWLLGEFIDTLRYPAGWVGKRIKLWDGDRCTGFYIHDPKGTPYIVALATDDTTTRAEPKLRELMESESTLIVGVAADTDTLEPTILRRNAYSGHLSFVPELDPYLDPIDSQTTRSSVLTAASGNGRQSKTRQLTPLSENLESIFFELHSVIRSIDALHAEEALDELCKVLFAKIYDERSTAPGKAYQLQRSTYGSADELASSLKEVYSSARTELARYRFGEGQASAFRDTIRLSPSALARVVEGLQNYSLVDTPVDVKGRAFQKMIAPAARSGMGQYFTPTPIVNLVVDCLRPNDGEALLDPFCGSAHFLSTAAERYPDDKFALFGIEKNERMVRVATVDAAMHSERPISITTTDALLDFSNYVELASSRFDVILTNPPFGSLLGRDSLASLGKFELANGSASVPLEILGLERSVQFLRPGGRLGIVLPEGLIANAKTRQVREWLDSQAKIRAVISLPLETFSPFGANVKTCVLILRKWIVGEDRTADYNVCMLKLKGVGYDSTGKMTGTSDVTQTCEEFRRFVQTEGW